MIQDGLLFRNSRLCIPKCSMRDNLIREKHSGGLASHFGHDKTFEQLQYFYYWPKMRFVRKSKNCQHAKGKSQNTGFYVSLLIPKRPWDAINMDFLLGLPKS